MYDHHLSSIKNITEYFKADDSVLALLLSGSIAHGFEDATSDVDILIVLPDAKYDDLVKNNGRLTFKNFDMCTYPGGFFDGKYISIDFIRRVAARGSEPARFLFDGAKILFSRVDGLDGLLQEVVQYPVDEKKEKIIRFRTQVEAWKWYCSEGLRRDNAYLLGTAVSKLVLFGTRLILAHNEVLYPFHKWMLRVLDNTPDKPDGILDLIDAVTRSPTVENIDKFYKSVVEFQDWDECPNGWGSQFMTDVELSWVDDKTPVDDL